MPRPRFEKLDVEKRARILETAGKEFAAHGYEEASLNHILQEAGISKGAAYYYFDDKADLFTTVLAHYWKHVLEHVRFDVETLDEKTFWPKLSAAYRESMAHMREQPWMLALMRTAMKRTGGRDAEGPLGPLTKEILDWTAALLTRGQVIGVVRGDLPMDLLFSLVMAFDEAADRWFMATWDRIPVEDLGRIVETLLSIAKRLLEPAAMGG
jgi:AcrR family transcriptional regulator